MSELYKSLLIIYPEIILSFVAMILLMLGSFFQKKSLNLIITISFLTLLFLSFHELIPISDKKVAFNSFLSKIHYLVLVSLLFFLHLPFQ